MSQDTTTESEPWNDDGDGFISGADGRLVAQVNPPDGPGYPDRADDHARLIAASPNLRDSAERAIALLTDVVDSDGNVDQESIDTAIEDLQAALEAAGGGER